MNKSLHCLIVSIIVFLMIHNHQSFSQTKFWQEKGQPVCIESGWQRNPKLCSDGLKGAIIAWEDLRSGASDLYAQHVDALGKLLWDVKGIPICSASGTQTISGIVGDGQGGAIIVWTDRRGNDADIYAQRINGNGNILWTKDGLAVCNASNDQTLPKIISDSAYGVIITWQDKRSNSSDIYAQRISSDGSMLWTTNGITVCNEIHDQTFPEIISDGNNGCIIVWNDKRNEEDLYAQRLSSDGMKLWNASGAIVCNDAGRQFGAKIAENGDGGACIVWQDLRSGTTTDIYYQVLDKSGNRKFALVSEALTQSAQAQTSLYIIADGIKGSLCSWTDYRGDPTTGDIYARRISEKGELQWTPFSGSGLPICNYIEAQDNTILLTDGAGGAFAVWQDHRNTYDYDLYMQRIDALGKTSFTGWQPNGTPLIVEDHNQFSPQLVLSGQGAAIIVWYDGRIQDGVADIYAQRVGFSSWFNSEKQSIDFGVLKVKTATTQTLTLHNDGALPMDVNTLRIVKIDPLDYSYAEKDFTLISPPATPFTIQPGDSVLLHLQFKTDSSSYRLARLQIIHNAPGNTNFIQLSGTGTDPRIAVSPTQCSFGIVKVQSIRDSILNKSITNSGNGTLLITNIELSGTHKDQFELINLPTFPIAIAPKGYYSFTIRFKPTSDGYKAAKILISNNATIIAKEIAVSGSGAFPTFEYQPFAVHFDTVGVGGFKGIIFSIINSGPVGLDLRQMKITGTDSSEFVITYYYPHLITVSDTYKVWINFTPKMKRERVAQLKIYTDAINSPETIQMNGFGGILNDIHEHDAPDNFILNQNYPNPFKTQSIIVLDPFLTQSTKASFKVHDIFGREVLNLSEQLKQNSIVIIMNTQLPNTGIYYYSLAVGNKVQTKMMTYLK